MSNSPEGAVATISIGHAIVRSNPWTFESADSQTRQLFDLPEGEVAGLPFFIPDYATPAGVESDTIDVMVAGTTEEDQAIRAKLFPLDATSGLYSAVFFHPAGSTGRAAIEALPQQDLQHRISNCLAVIRSIFRRTAQASPDTDTLVSHFLGRLDAFSRIQSNLALYDAYGVALDELILDEFMAHAMRTGNRLSVEGPSVRLRTRPAETVSLAIHELATNSVKFGALGTETGQIKVMWRREIDGEGKPFLFLEWRESGVTLRDNTPVHRGFGTEMIENSLAFELAASASVRSTPDGIRLQIRVPITDDLLHSEIDDGEKRAAVSW